MQHFEELDFEPLLSDLHCPVAFTINIHSKESTIISNEETVMADGSSEQGSTFPTWKPESRLEFINYIHESSLDQINFELDRLNESESVNADSIKRITSKISQTLVNVAENCNMIKKKNNLSANSQKELKQSELSVKSISLLNASIYNFILEKIMKIWCPLVEQTSNQ